MLTLNKFCRKRAMFFKSDCDVTPSMSNESSEKVMERARAAEFEMIYHSTKHKGAW